jgi:hypothetical protein
MMIIQHNMVTNIDIQKSPTKDSHSQFRHMKEDT